MTWIGLAIAMGCSGGSDKPSSPSGPPITGTWTTSTAPELADSATTMRFLPSGEYFIKGPLQVFGKAATYKDQEGKEHAAPFEGSGTWQRDGQTLRVTISQTNLIGSQGEPIVYAIKELAENRLVLVRGEETVTLFRATDPAGDAAKPKA